MRSFFFAIVGLCSLFAAGVLVLPSASSRAAPAGGGDTTETHYLLVTAVEAFSRQPGCPAFGVPVGGLVGTDACSDWLTSVHFPDGAVVTKMEAFFNDSVAGDGSFFFARSDLPLLSDSGTAFIVHTTGTPGDTSASVESSLPIDNSRYHYHLEITLGTGVGYDGVIFTYTLPAGAANANGDVDCDGDLTTRDNQALLRFVLVQPPLSQTQPCPAVGE